MGNENRVVFGFLDRQGDIDKQAGENLPHWFQAGSATFVTFRTADSMPRNAIERWRAELKRWLRDQGVSIENVTTTQSQTDSCSPEAKLEWAFSFDSLQPGQRQEFLRLRNRAWHRLLDECYGKCLLRQAKFAKIVARAILHYDRQKCDVDRLIVMPNHVHVIAQFRANTSLKIVSQSWMRYSAREINKELGTSGAFWQPEPFDHIIRNLKQFEYLQHYVADNARKAGLRDGEFLYWQQNNSSSP
jgi:REP element-mobilizing transposase RayT